MTEPTCTHPLWALASQERGHCEACHIRITGHSTHFDTTEIKENAE